VTDEIDRIAVMIPCDYCHIGPGHWCVTKTGNVAGWLHSARTRPIYELWSSAYQEGEVGGIWYAQRWADEPARIERYRVSLVAQIKALEEAS
jgi:hypothetical protein